MTEYYKAKCPSCGATLEYVVLTCNPPIHIARCPECGFEKNVDPFDTEKQPEKPPIGCKPYYVAISERIGELCEAIRRCAGEKEKHNQVKLWVNEIHLLNEMDRILRRVEAEKTWIENKGGTLKEVK